MNEFERLQDEFQRGIMSSDDKVLGEILDSPKEKRDILFGDVRVRVLRRTNAARIVSTPVKST